MQMGDFAAYDQVVWSLSELFSFKSSICGSIMNAWTTIGAKSAEAVPPLNLNYNALGIHFIPSLFFTNAIANFIYNSPYTTYLMQTLAFSISSVLLFYVLVGQKVSPWIATALAISFLIHPANIGANVNAFHPVTMAIPFLIILYYFAITSKIKSYWLLFFFIGFIQENLWITLTAFTLIFLFQKKWKRAAANLAIGLLFLILTTQFFIPYFNPEHTCPYCSIYGSPLGGSMAEIIKNIILKPGTAWSLLIRSEVMEWLNQLFKPTLYLVLLNPIAFLIAIAGIVPNILSTNKAMHIMWGQYNALAMPFLYLGAGLGFNLLQSKMRFKVLRYSWLWAFVILWVSIGAAKDWAVSSTTQMENIFTFNQPVYVNPDMKKSYDEVKERIPVDASVSATELFLNTINRRRLAFLFPVGFLEADYVVIEKSNLTIPKENYQPRMNDVRSSGKYDLAVDDAHIQLWIKKK
jgi:uncharacterized membrane protein